MLEFWHDFLNDKGTFIGTIFVLVIVPLLLALLVFLVSFEDKNKLNERVKELESKINN